MIRSSKEIIHLCVDDKFLGKYFIPNLKKFDDLYRHRFLILKNKEVLFPIEEADAKVTYITKGDLDEAFRNNFNQLKVIIHCYVDEMREAILRLPKNVEVICIVYGFEYYSKMSNLDIFQPESKRFVKSNNVDLSGKSFRYKLAYRRMAAKQKKRLKQSFKRIDVIAHYLPGEFQLFKKFLKLKAQYLEFNLGTVLQVLEIDVSGNLVEGNNVLLGNSGNATNNHLDLLMKVDESVRLEGGKVYCPLSYSCTSEDYVNAVINLGKEKFGDSFVPMLDFMTSTEFNKILSSCNKVILNQYRSQGGASIWSALYRGSALYLAEQNPFYSFLKVRGAHIFKIVNGKVNLTESLTTEQKNKNKEVLMDYFSEENVRKRYLKLIE